VIEKCRFIAILVFGTSLILIQQVPNVNALDVVCGSNDCASLASWYIVYLTDAVKVMHLNSSGAANYYHSSGRDGPSFALPLTPRPSCA
jgi:hypothetical protein